MQPKIIPYSYSQKHEVLLFGVESHKYILLVGPHVTCEILTEVQRFLQIPLKVIHVSSSEFQEKFAEVQAKSTENAADIVNAAEKEMNLAELLEDIPVSEDLLMNTQDNAPIIRTINSLITQAIHDSCSDIHLEPFENKTSIRFRIDGMLQEIATTHPAMHNALCSRIKVMAHLNIAEKRLPQDGRISLRLGARFLDIRVSVVPTLHGERIVLRILDKTNKHLTFSQLGMPVDMQSTIDQLLSIPNGIFLVTGPTGSGKTTTLYASIEKIKKGTSNIMTVEDPVEYDLPGVAQIPVHHQIQMNFARALKAILRQDPDVIMIGEIRDQETAQIAIQASLTGHLVIATLHTNDCPSTIARLIDMGVEPFLLAPALRGILAQRLIRKLCPHCRTSRKMTAKEVSFWRLPQDTLAWHPQGCEQCHNRGYHGRIGVFSILVVDKNIEVLIHDNRSEQDIRAACQEQKNYIEFIDSAQKIIEEGITSTEELIRILRGDEQDDHVSIQSI